MKTDKEMLMKTDSTMFESHNIRPVYDEESETWWFSVIDIIQVLTQQPDYQAARNYWKVLKNRLAKEGRELVTNCNQLKMTAGDGKQRETDATLDRKSRRINQPTKK
jgi:DNA-damage-inducible protein D